MRTIILLIAVAATACTSHTGELGRESTPGCAKAERAHAKANKDYEDARQRAVESPTERSQRKLAEASADLAKAANAGAAAGCLQN